MREVLQNFVNREPIPGHKPKLEDLRPVETNGFLTATYPRINMDFLKWRREKVPQFAVFTPEADRCIIGHDQIYNDNPGWREWARGYVSDMAGNRQIFPQVFRDKFADVAERFKNSPNCLGTTYSGLMTDKVRTSIKEFREANIDANIWVVAEVEPSAWETEEVGYEDPLIIVSRRNVTWLLGWYDLTEGEDHVLGTFAE